MTEVLRNKNLTTRFQILVEIADKGPNVQQKDIARRLEITPQAVSDYITQLIKDGMLVSEGRSHHSVTKEGVNWIIETLKDLNNYILFIQRAVNNISVCAAIAESDLKRGQKINLKMKDGLLFASNDTGSGATGIATSNARQGEDVGVSSISGIVPLEPGRVTILKIPSIERGGSRKVNYSILREHLKGCPFVASLGLESFATLRNIGIEFCRYGAMGTAIEAAQSGLNSLVVCVENETFELITKLEKQKIRYLLIDAESP